MVGGATTQSSYSKAHPMASLLLTSLLTLAAFSVWAGPTLGDPAPVRLLPNLLDEACELKTRNDLAAEPGMPQDQLLVCAGRIAGSVVTIPFINDDLVQSYMASRAHAQNQLRMNCPEQAVSLQGLGLQNIVALGCRLSSGGWPHLVLVATSTGNESHAIALDSFPAMLPSMLALVQPSFTKTLSRSQLVQALQTVFGGAVPLASAADLLRFKAQIKDARAANAQGRYEDAESLFRQALDLQTKLLSPRDIAIAETLMDLALNVSNQGRDEEALALFRRAEPIVQVSPQESDRARFASYQGYHAANAGRYDEALAFASAATAAWRKIAQGPNLNLASLTGSQEDQQDPRAFDKGELALALNLQANMALRLDELALAQAAASEALQILKETRGLPAWWRSDILLTLGKVSSAQGRLSAAEQYLNVALEEKRLAVGEGAQTLRIQIALAQAYEREGMSTSAIITYRQVFQAIKAMPPSSLSLITKEDLMAFGRAVLRYAQTLNDDSQRQGLFNEAFDAFQLVRPSLVSQTITRASMRLAADDPTLAEHLDALQQAQRDRDTANLELSFESALPDDQRSKDIEDALLRKKQEAQARLTQLSQSLRKDFPNFAALGFPAQLTAFDLRRQLASNEAVVSFLLGEKQSFVQLIRRDGIRMSQINLGLSELQDWVTRLRRPLETQAGSIGPFDLKLSYELYQQLLGPVEKGLEGIQHLVVIPSGPLASLPLGLLVRDHSSGAGLKKDTGNSDASYVSAAWLVRTLSISHVPSLQAFYQQRTSPKVSERPKALFAIGDPVLKGRNASRDQSAALSALASSCRQQGPASGELLRALSPLPETRSELASVARALSSDPTKTTVLFGEKANETALRSASLQDYAVIYFATHGLLPGELKCQAEPGLVLTPPNDSQSKSNDGLLETSEIATLRLKADLVVLSACNTAGSAGRFGGDALSGLAEAFFHAGARRMVVSHWQVPSQATADLMVTMFTTMGPQRKVGPARSLQAAQLRLIESSKTAHPFYWAAFVVIGDGMDESGLPMPRGAQALLREPLKAAR